MGRIDAALKRANANPGEAAVSADPQAETRIDDPQLWIGDGEGVPADGTDQELADTPLHAQTGVSRADLESAEPLWQAPPDEAPPMALFRGFAAGFAEKLVVTPDIRPAAAVEQYRRLAATLHHAQVQRGIRLVMVASAVPGEGKTLTATNLALTFSESYRRQVLLVDADLRRPMLHEVFQLPNVSGLNESLKAETEQTVSVLQVSSQLSVLTAGRPDPDPMSGLTSHRMRWVLKQAASNFDWVIIDTPPVGLLPDANLLAAMVDTVVLVIQAGATSYKSVQRTVEALGRDRVVGAILNRVDVRIATPGYEYDSYYRRDPLISDNGQSG